MMMPARLRVPPEGISLRRAPVFDPLIHNQRPVGTAVGRRRQREAAERHTDDRHPQPATGRRRRSGYGPKMVGSAADRYQRDTRTRSGKRRRKIQADAAP